MVSVLPVEYNPPFRDERENVCSDTSAIRALMRRAVKLLASVVQIRQVWGSMDQDRTPCSGLEDAFDLKLTELYPFSVIPGFQNSKGVA